MMTEPPDLYRPIKRIRQACVNCRRKKARCTGERPECAFCVRLGQSCSYEEESGDNSSGSQTERRFKRNESNASIGSDQENITTRMAALESQMTELTRTVHGLNETLQESLAQITQHISPSGVTSAPPSVVENESTQYVPYTRLPPHEIIRNAGELYFRYCHNQPYSLFHEASFRQKIEAGEIPTHLQFALVASTVRYSSDPFFEDKNAALAGYAQQSWKAIAMPWNGMTDTELSIVQTILLLAIIDYTDGRTQGSWIKIGLAIRLAQDFKLMVEPDKELGPIQQEERRRVFWSFFLCDKMVSCGRERPPVISDHQCKLQLPADEDEWRAGQYCQAPTLDKLVDDNADSVLHTLSPFAIAVVMASLLGRCAQYALGEQEEPAPGGKTHPWNPRSKYSSIHSALLQLESELGLNEPLSTKITQRFTSKDGTIDQHRAAPLVLAHALFFLCQCLLYHPFLIKQRLARLGQRTPQSFLTQTLNSCRSAAVSLSHLMEDVKSLNVDTLKTFYDSFSSYLVMVAASIHTMFMNASDPSVVEMAKTSFEASSTHLKELSQYWKHAGMMLPRLEHFRQSSEQYATLVDPTIQEVRLSPEAANDLIECLDYSRMSTAPRSKAQNSANLATLSQLPSPFFEEFVNMLPIGYSRPLSVMPGDDFFGQSPRNTIFDNHFFNQDSTAGLYSNTGMSFPPTLPTNDLANHTVANQAAAAATSLVQGFSPASSNSFSNLDTSTNSAGRRGSQASAFHSATHSAGMLNSVDQAINGISPPQSHMQHLQRRGTGDPMAMKRPWYEG